MQQTIVNRPGMLLLLTLGWLPAAPAQVRDWRVHSRGLLHQTVYNTGELGRAYNAGGTVQEGFPSMEWPPRSRMIIDRTQYPGQHNSFGSGIWIAGTRPGGREYAFCGAVSDGNGNPVTVTGVYSTPLAMDRRENFPVLASGELNPAFNPDEAEEIITSRWGTPVGITVTRTSRAWSYPGYDSFIIYEYELANATPDTLRDVHVVFATTLGPSMFGYQRNHGLWSEAQYRGQPPNGFGDHFARFDLKRWMTYNHEREGIPDTTYFDLWSAPGNRGGLNSPQAAGLMMLSHDYGHIARRGETDQVWIAPADSNGMWDGQGRVKQPFLLRYENGNLPPEAKTIPWLNPALQRKTGVFQGAADSGRFSQLRPRNPADWTYWKGRTKGAVNLSWWQPVFRAYGFYPYLLPPGEALRFAVAEVVGYGPGVGSDSVYTDLGGAIRTGVDQGAYFNPVPSWYDTLEYPFAGTAATRSFMGSRYLQDHPLPWYVTPGVVSIRDVADRAIQMYTGRPLAKHDTLQYDPAAAPQAGLYATIPIPAPAPAIRVEDTRAAANRIIWGPQVEQFSTPRLRAPFKHYEVMRATHPLGPWVLVDSVARRDARYFNDSVYTVLDPESNLGDFVYYAVVSVDSLGGRSGMTNITEHETQAPAAPALGKVYVIPNPLIVTNGLRGSDPNGEVTDKVQFVGLTDRCTIRIFSYSGQLINTIEHDRDTFGNPWYQITRNNQLLASGVYFFTVEDESGARARGKFVIIH
ncbi:MAG: T9SS type A sorting domain-containing protein [Bacteroidota bacterium]